MKGTLVYSVRAATGRQSVALFHLSRKRVRRVTVRAGLCPLCKFTHQRPNPEHPRE